MLIIRCLVTELPRSVRLGDLEGPASAAAAAAGMTLSEWIRQAVAARLAIRPDLSPQSNPSTGESARVTLRTTQSNLARWHELAHQHGLALSRYIELELETAADSRSSVAHAVGVLATEAASWAFVGQRLDLVARHLATSSSSPSPKHLSEIVALCAEINRHRRHSSALTRALRDGRHPSRARSHASVRVTEGRRP